MVVPVAVTLHCLQVRMNPKTSALKSGLTAHMMRLGRDEFTDELFGPNEE